MTCRSRIPTMPKDAKSPADYVWSYDQVMQYARVIAGNDDEFLRRIYNAAYKLKVAGEPISICMSDMWKLLVAERLIKAGLLHEDGSPKWPHEIKDKSTTHEVGDCDSMLMDDMCDECYGSYHRRNRNNGKTQKETERGTAPA